MEYVTLTYQYSLIMNKQNKREIRGWGHTLTHTQKWLARLQTCNANIDIMCFKINLISVLNIIRLIKQIDLIFLTRVEGLQYY